MRTQIIATCIGLAIVIVGFLLGFVVGRYQE